MDFKTIKLEREDKIGIIILNRPEKRNAISIQMRKEIINCLNNWEKSKDISIIIFTGSGSTFSSGYDLKEFNDQALLDEIFRTSSEYHRVIWNFPKPTIGAINGAALAGGFDLVTLCDIRICSKSSFFGHPEIKLGIPVLYTPLRWIVGIGMARDICLTGRIVDSKEAHQIGLVSEVVEDDSKLLERSIQIGKGIIEANLEIIQSMKTYFNDVKELNFEGCFCIEHDRIFKEFIESRKYKKE